MEPKSNSMSDHNPSSSESPLSSLLPPSTPQPHYKHSGVHLIEAALAPVPSSPVLHPGPPTTLLGSLHLKRCSLEEYLDIEPSVYGTFVTYVPHSEGSMSKYSSKEQGLRSNEHVERILVAIPISKELHDNIVRYLHNHATARYIRGEIKYPSCTQEGVAICNVPSFSGNSQRRRTIRRPDLIVAARLSQSERNQLSSKSRRTCHPKSGEITTGEEVTCKNEKTDTEVKPKEYDSTKMKVLAIVHRDANCKDESKRDQRVEVRRRIAVTDSWGNKKVYRGNSVADMVDFGAQKPSTLFSNPDPAGPLNDVAEQIREGKKREEEMKKRVEEVEKREEESKNRYEESRKREKELQKKLEDSDNKKRRYKNIVRTKVPDKDVRNSSESWSTKTNNPESKRGRETRSLC